MYIYIYIDSQYNHSDDAPPKSSRRPATKQQRSSVSTKRDLHASKDTIKEASKSEQGKTHEKRHIFLFEKRLIFVKRDLRL